LDFSEEALYALYENETFGTGVVAQNNGYAHGKKWMGVAVAQWREDMYRSLWPVELYSDPDLPDWWLDKVLPEFVRWREFGKPIDGGAE
jgi:hypothetical protein